MLFRILFSVFAVKLSFLLSVFYEETLYFMVSAFGTGWVFTTIFLRLMVMISFWFGMRYLLSMWPSTRKIKGWIVVVLCMAAGFGISMIFPNHRIYQGDYGTNPTDKQQISTVSLSNATNGQFKLMNGRQLVTFFELECPHCKRLCRKMGANIAGGMSIPVSAFFMAPQSVIDRFLVDNGGEGMAGFTLDPPVFLDNAGFTFPSTFLIDKSGATISHWSGDNINYTALDELMDME